MSLPTNHRLLVIDDNRAIHDDFRKILCPAGESLDDAEAAFFGETATMPAQPVFEIDSAFQGEEGVAALARALEEGRPYAMAFVDVRMPPGMDGIETIERLWQLSPDLQVVVCTAFSDYSWEEMVSRLHNRDRLLVLKKPFASIEALQLACALTAKWALTRQAREQLAETERCVAERTGELREAVEKLRAEITQRELIESHLLRAQRLESIGTLASGVAHDLNNMLNPILMGVSLLAGRQADEGLEMIVETIGTSSERAAGVVKQLLTFARGVEGDRIPLDARYVLRDLKKIIAETFPKNIELKMMLSPDLSIIESDATQLHQILLNLCVNARDAMPDGGSITVEAENFVADENYASMTPEAHPGPYLLLRVRDTGCGIPRALLDKIYDPFFTTKPVGKGTGLGLSAVAGIVRGHGGFMNVASQPGQGTVFEIFLPAQREECLVDKLPGAKTAPRGHGELVLVVDDESAVREVTGKILRENGYETVVAADGTEAVTIFAAHACKIKAVLTDVLMPFLDGVALCRSLRKMDPLVKLIVSTGEEEPSRRSELEALRVHGFLAKPYGAEVLLETLATVLGGGSPQAVLA